MAFWGISVRTNCATDLKVMIVYLSGKCCIQNEDWGIIR